MGNMFNTIPKKSIIGISLGKIETFLRMLLSVKMIMWESSEERINENYYIQKRLVWVVNSMDNGRLKYVNIERISIGDIFTLLDSVESDDEGDI